MPHSTLEERKAEHERLRKIAGNETIHNVMLADLDWRKRPAGQAPDLMQMRALLTSTAAKLMLIKKKPAKSIKHSLYSKIWRIVDGAVKDALHKHPDYLTIKGKVSARDSINKRAVGAVQAFIRRDEEANRGSSSVSCDSDTG
jgi:hypothetical protein